MYSKRSGQGSGDSRPVRASDRLRRRPKVYGRPYMYYSPAVIRPKRSKTKTRTAASQIAKMLRPGSSKRPIQTSNADSVATNLRRSTRKRRISVNLEPYTDSTGTEDNDLMNPKYRSSRNRIDVSVSQDDLLPRREGLRPRRAGLRPRRSKAVAREQLNIEYDDDERGTSDEKVGREGPENGDDLEDNDDEVEDEGGIEGDGDDEEEAGDEGDEDGDDDDDEGEEEQEGRRRYDLRNRADVRRMSLEEGKQRPRSPRRVLQQGMGTKLSRDVRRGGSRVHKRNRLTRAEDSDDSLLVDELDQGPPIPWGRGGSRSGPPWLLGGLDMHGTTAWGLNVAASGWGHQGDALANLNSGVQTAGPSSKGGADIQPLQIDESVSFDDIGGLSEFDREFNFPLPGCEARAEILDIHTRKWRQPPSKDLKLELAASCVGYCGADLKALCTEAAIRAFREKYPQVYTSDDKFLIDVDSVNVEKYHFVEAMSTITPAAHRGSVVQSRPLSAVVASCLQRHFQKAMSVISEIFPALAVSSELTKLSMLSYGSAIPLVYRPRLLLCGVQGVGLDHLGPAILHELEKFPMHCLGLSSLLSDPSAKTPEEALVHIFGEARRTTPSILYLPQYHLWWENSHEQLKAVLVTLLEELPSNSPILLLGTSSDPRDEQDEGNLTIFHRHNIYQVDEPSNEDRSLFFDCLIRAALSISSEGIAKFNKPDSIPELPRAPKVATGPKASEVKAKVEAEGHALRRLRMCLRDVCNRILYDKRFSAFHYPVMDEDAPNYRSIIQNPMDMATLLLHVDCGKYMTCKAFLEDFDLILINAKRYNGDDYNGARIVSRAYELRDVVHGMLTQIDPALVAFCEKIAAEGGPAPMPDDLESSPFSQAPVVQMATLTRASARLRNVQPVVNLDQSYDALKRTKKNTDATHAAEDETMPLDPQEVVHPKTSQEPEGV
ncbi:hypothetical protein RJ639_016146, partial [Escallonia herrerae]